MLFTFCPSALDTSIKFVRARTVYERFSNVSFQSISRFSSYRHPADPSVSNPGPHLVCEKADRETYRQILINADQHNLEYTFQLLMNIVRRPCLGHFVKKIEYVHRPISRNQGGGDYVFPELPYQRDLGADDMRLLRRAVENAGFKDEKEESIITMLMQKELNQNLGHYTTAGRHRLGIYHIAPVFITQAIAAIFVSMSPNLETMAMAQPFDRRGDLEEGETWAKEFPLVEVFRYANSRPDRCHYLQKLRDVYLVNREAQRYSDSRFYYDDTDLIAWLKLFNKLPSIESFGIDVLGENENDGKPICEDRGSNISKIRINHSMVTSSYLLCVMASSKIIKELQYTIGGRGDALDEGYHLFNPKAFIKALSAHKQTLEVLDMDTEMQTYTYPGQLQPGGSYPIDWDAVGGPGEFDFDLYAEDELDENMDELKMHRYLTSIWDRNASLKEFGALKELSLGIGLLIYFSQGVEMDNAKRSSVMLVDSLPDSLEYLSIRGYRKGVNVAHDAQVTALMDRFKSGSLRLKEIKGVYEMIPNGENVENPDQNEHLLWSFEEIGYSNY
ncbi:uncharacterized protein N7479_009096 [Penicillium vulpinum]|uniref:Uncharacterized protein n=1 Tax=Penicillium vulpinum TaxID=29845 RepID=A0A1V6RU64_9EURO|nr:uncharacterized protein N7479_009096 [Penicillium vulpinum]KAJ5950683.1 hypothetical protein N7479_009096 [Penicillium vulpinum]OQE05029.1 hypothetical protein PENVUL_c028G01849 [Penicillium vulpinum]